MHTVTYCILVLNVGRGPQAWFHFVVACETFLADGGYDDCDAFQYQEGDFSIALAAQRCMQLYHQS
jgi:hypothetical protein